eukprot:m.141587 g.141587  ORF g.141587 m.141587 type:complete len:241 (-) comp22867_c1_seq2:123-845(-)
MSPLCPPPTNTNTNTTKAAHGLPRLTFDAKYFGPVPGLVDANSGSPNLERCVQLMGINKRRRSVYPCTFAFTQAGVTVSNHTGTTVYGNWAAENLAEYATAQYPNSKTRRIALFKIVDKSPSPIATQWHLFNYHGTSSFDNVSECFQYVVNSGLGEMERDCAADMALGWGSGGTPLPDWEEPTASQMVSTTFAHEEVSTRRELQFDKAEHNFLGTKTVRQGSVYSRQSSHSTAPLGPHRT